MSVASLVMSVLALSLSAITAWLTLFRRGTVRMTQPTVIYFGLDKDGPPPKVFLRTLLFSTAKRGCVLESMYVRVTRGETRQNFNVWVYGDDKVVRGSGLFIGESGIAVNHHFLPPKDAASFRFLAGQYRLEVYARVLGESAHRLLFEHTLEVTREDATALEGADGGIYFDWGPDSSGYASHVDKRPPPPTPQEVLEMLGGNAPLFTRKGKPKT